MSCRFSFRLLVSSLLERGAPLRRLVPVFLIIVVGSGSLRAQTLSIPGADGSDGVIDTTGATSTVFIDLGAAPVGNWDDPGTGLGVYDTVRGVVVLKPTSVLVAAGTTLRFTDINRNVPVMILCSGDFTVEATAFLRADGANAQAGATPAFSGAGGHRGAANGQRPGFGPGGGAAGPGGVFGGSGGGAHATLYGNPALVPLTGGSGGGSRSSLARNGGAGGGAFLLACTGSFTIDGEVRARGGSGEDNAGYSGGGGAGGGIRIAATSIVGTGLCRADGGAPNGGDGRIRFDVANGNPPAPAALVSACTPLPSQAFVVGDLTLFPLSTEPSVTIDTVGGVPFPTDVRASLDQGEVDVAYASSGPTEITITTENLDPTAITVVLRLVTTADVTPLTANATLVSGDTTQASWTATIDIPDGRVHSLTVHAKPN